MYFSVCTYKSKIISQSQLNRAPSHGSETETFRNSVHHISFDFKWQELVQKIEQCKGINIKSVDVDVDAWWLGCTGCDISHLCARDRRVHLFSVKTSTIRHLDKTNLTVCSVHCCLQPHLYLDVKEMVQWTENSSWLRHWDQNKVVPRS